MVTQRENVGMFSLSPREMDVQQISGKSKVLNTWLRIPMLKMLALSPDTLEQLRETG